MVKRFLLALLVLVLTYPSLSQVGNGPIGPTLGSGGGASLGTDLTAYKTVLVSSVSELTSAVSAASSDTTIILTPGTYSLTAPLTLTNKTRVTIEGNGATLSPSSNSATWADAFLVEMQGSDRCQVYNLRIRNATASGSNLPAGGLLLARTATNTSAGRHVFTNVVVDGEYEFASVVNICSEINQWNTCHIENNGNGGTATSHAMYITNAEPASADTDASGPIDTATFALTGPATVDVSDSWTMTGQTFINCTFSRFWGTVNTGDSAVFLDHSAGGSFGNIRFQGCWFNANPNGGGSTTSGSCIRGMIVFQGQVTPAFGLHFEDCLSECDHVASIFQVMGTNVILHGFVSLHNRWSSGERILDGGTSSILIGARIDDDGYNATGDHDWSYDSSNVLNVTSGAYARPLYDFYSAWECEVNGTSTALGIQRDESTVGVRNALGTQTTGTRSAWSIVRVRNSSLRGTYKGLYLTDILPSGSAGSVVTNTERQAAGAVFSDVMQGGYLGGATSVHRFVYKKSSIADNTATDLLRITIPNANHSAAINIIFNGFTADYHVSRTARGLVVVNRLSGDNAVGSAVAIANAGAASAATGTTTMTAIAYSLEAVSGAVGATNTIDIQVTSDLSSGTWTCEVLVEVINANASGITVSGL